MTPKTPMLDRMRRVKAESQRLGEFLTWLGKQGLVLARPCPVNVDVQSEGGNVIVTIESGLAPDDAGVERLLARYFEIDAAQVEAERRALLDSLREPAPPPGVDVAQAEMIALTPAQSKRLDAIARTGDAGLWCSTKRGAGKAIDALLLKGLIERTRDVRYRVTALGKARHAASARRGGGA
jgi:hypothetical protein